MSATALEKRLELYLPPRADLRSLAETGTLVDAVADGHDFKPWELHSELVLIDPELRLESLQLLPEPSLDALAKSPRRVIVVPATADESALPHGGILRYAAHRVGETTRFGLAIVGTIFTLAMLAEVLAR
jgi:hypothetical protein